jgi:hypothetical protein
MIKILRRIKSEKTVKLEKAVKEANYPRFVWWFLIIAGSLVIILGGVVGLPVNWPIPRQIQWIARVLLGCAFLFSVVASISGHSVISIAKAARTRLEDQSVHVQFIAVALSGFILLGGASAAAVSVLEGNAQSNGIIQSFPDLVNLTNASAPNHLALTSGGAWVGDHNQSVVTYVSKDGTSRQYFIPGNDNQIGGIFALPVDGSGNAWALEASVPSVIQGFSPSGTLLRRISVGDSTTLVIDKSGIAWAAETNSNGGANVYSINLLTGHVTKKSIFTDSPVTAVFLTVDPNGQAWLLAQITNDDIHGKGGSKVQIQTYRSAKLALDKSPIEVPIKWPTASLSVFAAGTSAPILGDVPFAVDRLADLWVGGLGFIAKVMPNGNVIRYPLFTDMNVQQITILSPTEIVFSADEGILDKPDVWTTISKFNPETMNKFPSVKRLSMRISDFVPTARSGTVMAGEPGIHALVTIPYEDHQATSIPGPAATELEQIITSYFQDLSKLRASKMSNRNIIIGEKNLDQQIISDLGQVISTSTLYIGPELIQLIKTVQINLGRVVQEYDSIGLIKASDPSELPGGFIDALTLRSDTELSLAELDKVITNQTLTSNGDLMWTPCKASDDCNGP